MSDGSTLAGDAGSGKPVAWNVPYSRNPHFVGRQEELADLRKSLVAVEPARRIQAICGLGGVGKTQLALEFCDLHEKDYRIVWWINADEPATLALGYAKLATRLGLKIPEGTSLDDIRHALRRVLNERNDWLLVFDNVAGADDVKNYFPQDRTGHVIVTSRNPNWESVARPFHLRPLKRVDSVQFLISRTGAKKSDSSVGMLAQALGDLPLALEQAAACIERTKVDFSGYLKRFETHWAELLGEVRPSGDYPDSVEMTWEISFRQLQDEHPESATLLNLFAFLGPDSIPRELLRDGAAVLPETLAGTVSDIVALDRAVASLRSYSLVDDDGKHVSVHRLVGTLVRERLPEAERRMWAETAIKLIICSFKFDSHELASWDHCAQLLPHALAAAWHAEANEVASRATITVLDDAGRYLIKRAQFDEARGLLERAYALAGKFYGQTHPQVAAIANNLGRVHRLLGQLDEARACFERSIEIDQQVYGESDPHLAAVSNNYGILLHEGGDIEGAKRQFEWAKLVYETHYGADHPKVASIVNNLGYVLKGSGDIAGGMAHFERALEIATASYGDNHPVVGAILVNLAIVQRQAGDLPGAMKNLQRALEINETSAGATHPHTARALGNLGVVLAEQKMLGAAREKFERALQIEEGFYGINHAAVAARSMQLGQVLRALNDNEGAQKYFDRATAINSARSALLPAG
jgi:Tfp pilus assembly protein PilF